MKPIIYFILVPFLLILIVVQPLSAQQDDLVWATHFGGDKGVVLIRDIEVGADGNVYSVGEARDSADMDPDTGSAVLSNLETRSFIQKMDSSANFQWGVEFGGMTQVFQNIRLDAQENVFVFGQFESTLKIYPQDSVLLSVPSGHHGFAAKFSSAGQLLWARYIESQGVFMRAAAVSGDGRSIFSGVYSDTVDVMPNQPGGNLTDPFDGNNSFLIEYAPNGNVVWYGQMEGAMHGDYLCVQKADFDAIGNVYLSGYLSGMIDFNPAPHLQSFESNSMGRGLFVMKLDSQRQFQWVKAFKSVDQEMNYLRAMTVDPQSNVYFAADQGCSVYYDNGGSNDTLSIVGNTTILASVDASGTVNFVEKIGNLVTNLGNATDLIYAPDQTLRMSGKSRCCSGSFAGTFDLDGNLLKSLIFPGQCGPEAYGVGVDDHGHMYVGGFFMQDVRIDMGDGFFDTLHSVPFDGFVAKYKNCDLEVNITVDEGSVLAQTNQSNLQYQWIDCISGEAISGATTYEFSPTEPGYYKLKVSDGNCTDFSACEIVYPALGINEKGQGSFAVYPNPSAGEVTLETPSNGIVQCLTASGRLVFEQKINAPIVELNTEPLEKGIYFLRFKSDQQEQVIRMVRSE